LVFAVITTAELLLIAAVCFILHSALSDNEADFTTGAKSAGDANPSNLL
jgi:hypothetical protein